MEEVVMEMVEVGTCTHKVVVVVEIYTHMVVVEKEMAVEVTCTHKVEEVMSMDKHLQTLNLHCLQQQQWPRPLTLGAKTDPSPGRPADLSSMITEEHHPLAMCRSFPVRKRKGRREGGEGGFVFGGCRLR
ncbi:hypothetical protein QUC31_017016 [Theobroma cacao]